MTSFISAVVAFLFVAPTLSIADTSCTQGIQTSRNLQIQTYLLAGHTQNSPAPECVVLISPVNAPTSYRIYTIAQGGIVQIFNDYDLNDPNSSKSTGARTYFFFPRRNMPSASVMSDGSGKVQVVTASGVILSFDPGKVPAAGVPAVPPSLISKSGDPILVSESSEVVPTNEGGVELTQTSTSGALILDTGFMLGDAAYTNQSGSSKFTDPKGVECDVKNSEIFTYSSSSEPELKYPQDADLWAFLATRCPKLSLPTLQ